MEKKRLAAADSATQAGDHEVGEEPWRRRRPFPEGFVSLAALWAIALVVMAFYTLFPVPAPYHPSDAETANSTVGRSVLFSEMWMDILFTTCVVVLVATYPQLTLSWFFPRLYSSGLQPLPLIFVTGAGVGGMQAVLIAIFGEPYARMPYLTILHGMAFANTVFVVAAVMLARRARSVGRYLAGSGDRAGGGTGPALKTGVSMIVVAPAKAEAGIEAAADVSGSQVDSPLGVVQWKRDYFKGFVANLLMVNGLVYVTVFYVIAFALLATSTAWQISLAVVLNAVSVGWKFMFYRLQGNSLTLVQQVLQLFFVNFMFNIFSMVNFPVVASGWVGAVLVAAQIGVFFLYEVYISDWWYNRVQKPHLHRGGTLSKKQLQNRAALVAGTRGIAHFFAGTGFLLYAILARYVPYIALRFPIATMSEQQFQSTVMYASISLGALVLALGWVEWRLHRRLGVRVSLMALKFCREHWPSIIPFIGSALCYPFLTVSHHVHVMSYHRPELYIH